jgi:hypothetical protein
VAVSENDNSAIDKVRDLIDTLADELNFPPRRAAPRAQGQRRTGQRRPRPRRFGVSRRGAAHLHPDDDQAEAESFGIPERERWLYVRHDGCRRRGNAV